MTTPIHDASEDARHASRVSLYATIGAFGTYFCMYGFRKPFVVPSYAEILVFGIGFKKMAVTVQVLGYMVSKFVGIRVIAEMPPARRAITLLKLVFLAEFALLLYAVVPPPWNLACLFLNGLPLGMVFGLVLGFLEGRRTTEALAAILCASFIMADGAVKSVGARLLEWGIPTFWMPFAAGGIFIVPLLICTWMLSRVPPPTARDVAQRSSRQPMSRAERRAFLRNYGLGFGGLVACFLLITILRSIRADFQPEIWRGLSVVQPPGIYARTEFCVALVVTLINGLGIFIVNNRRAFAVSLGVSLAGLLLIPLSVIGQQRGWLSPFAFMVSTGMGLYLPYMAFHTTIFERLIAITRDRANLGFLMYVADAIGYLGYVAVVLVQGAVGGQTNFLAFFMLACWVVGVLAALSLVLAACYLLWQLNRMYLAGAAE